MNNQVSILDIIKNESVQMLMQIVLSPHEDFAVGFEALARGIDPSTGESIEPTVLFELAKEYGLCVEVDKLCVKKALMEFAHIYRHNPSALLFINIECCFMEYLNTSEYLIECADHYEIPYENIVIDLSNFNVQSMRVVEVFITKYRKMGFYMSIDDIGQDYFNLDKLILINPDIIKINYLLLNRLESQQYRKYLPRFLSNIAHEMGMVVVAKGIETAEDFREAMKTGAQFVQGYYLSKPSKLSADEIDVIIRDFKDKEQINQYFDDKQEDSKRNTLAKLIQFMDKIKEEIDGFYIGYEGENFRQIFKEYGYVENCWVLDKNGIQVSDAYINKENFDARNLTIFNITKKNMDFSSKELYVSLVNNILDVWITKPFHSLLTNNICIGVSKYIVDSEGESYILCLNINRSRFVKDEN